MSDSSASRENGGETEPLGLEEFEERPLNGLSGWWRKTFAALSVRNYRLFTLGQGMSLVGTWARRTAMGWLVYKLTGSKAMLGMVEGLALLPMFPLSPIAGAIADRVNKRRVVMWTQIVGFVTSGILSALVGLNVVRISDIMILAVLGGVAFAFEVPSRQAFVNEMVGRRHLMNAIGLNSALVNGARIVGPAVAGLLMGTVGMAACFALDALSYLVSAWMLMRIQMPPPKIPPRTSSHWDHLLEGMREVRRNIPVRTALTLLSLTTGIGWACQTLMPAIAQGTLRVTEIWYGVLLSSIGIGAIVGALYVAGHRDDSTRMRIIYTGIGVMVAGLYAVSLTRYYWLMCACLLLVGFGGVIMISAGNTVVQSNVADSIRGRVMGIWALTFGGALPLGNFIIGFLAEYVSPFTAIQIFATVLLVGTLIVGRGWIGAALRNGPHRDLGDRGAGV